MARDAEKGKLLLGQKFMPSELAPDFVVRWHAVRQYVFFNFALYEKGVEFRYSGKGKTPLFVDYSKIKRVYFTTRDCFKLYEDIEIFPAWFTISVTPRLVSTYPSRRLKVGRIRRIFEEHGCPIERRIVTNDRMIYDYSIKKYSFDTEGFTIVFYDGLERNYLWGDVEHVSDLTDDPYKVEFYTGDKLLIHPLESEFIIRFGKEYKDFLERST